MQMKYWALIIYTFFAVSSCTLNNNEKKAKELIEKCNTLQVGMNYSRVINVMGQPINIVQYSENGVVTEVLYFHSPSLASTLTQCTINKSTGEVEEIICGEN